MQKIRSRADAREVAEKFINEKLTIQLWDEFEDNRLMEYVEACGSRIHRVNFIDTVNGTSFSEKHTVEFIASVIWSNRKFINQSGQLGSL